MSNQRIPVTELPERLLLDFSSDCNLKCPMCVVHGTTDDPRVAAVIKKSMKIEHAKQILDEVAGKTHTIGPGLWSEPLMGKDILLHLRSVKQRGMAVSMNTNALLLNKKMAQELVEIGVDSITVSIDSTTPETLNKIRGITNLDKIERHVLDLLVMRGEQPAPRIGVSFTKQPANLHEEQEFIAKWTQVVDFVRIGEVFENGKFPAIDLSDKPRVPCGELYRTMAVHTNGDVSICCLDGFKEMIVGNVVETSVKDVWNGDKLNHIRALHEAGKYDEVPFCKNCDRWASNEYSEQQQGELLIRKSPEYTFYNRLDKLESWQKR